jgi:hypothetical protein
LGAVRLLDYQWNNVQTVDFYTATLRTAKGLVLTVPFAGASRSQVLYAVTELYPDCHVVRINRDDQWEESVDGQAAHHD